jgi:hypothetical protein
MLTPNKVSIARNRFEVREIVIGTRIACSASTNHRKRSWAFFGEWKQALKLARQRA